MEVVAVERELGSGQGARTRNSKYSRTSVIRTSVIRIRRSTERYAKPHPPQFNLNFFLFFFIYFFFCCPNDHAPVCELS